jgi:MSHA biogenesis protein MshP
MNAAARHRDQRGMALLGAIFVLVVLAALGAYAVRINMTQQHDAELELHEQRAQAALNTGIEYAAARLLASGANNCANLATLVNLAGGFTVTFNGCVYAQYFINGVAVNVHTVNVVTSRGVYGTPDYVLRRASGVRIVG